MNEPRNGRGALSLLLRLSMLRARQRGGASLAERGYALAVALIAAFVLLLGVGALASRGQLGFIGQVFQVQNRQARDVAEAAIAQFANTMNNERNRYLLVANSTADWTTNADNRNVCTIYGNDGSLIDENDDPENSATFDTVVADADDPLRVTRFLPSAGFQDLVDGDDSRQFDVESIEYLRADRSAYDANTRDSLITANTRALIRITVIGQVSQNNRTSRARVAREFEVVPKCCKRSFGANAAQNWGRDRAACELEDPNLGSPQFRVGLNGGGVAGSKNQLDIRDENGDLMSQAVCWAGTEDGTLDPNSALDPDADLSACEDGELAIGITGNPNNLGITFSPAKFDVVLPDYAVEAPVEPLSIAAGNEEEWFDFTITHEELSIGNDKYIYYQQPFSIDVASINETDSEINFQIPSDNLIVDPRLGIKNNFAISINVDPASGAALPAGIENGKTYFAEIVSPVTIDSDGNAVGGEVRLYDVETTPTGIERTQVSLAGLSAIISAISTNDYDITVSPGLLICDTTANGINVSTCELLETDDDGYPVCYDRILADDTANPPRPYAEVNCRLRNIDTANQEIIIDTSKARINFFFDDSNYASEYMGGGGNTEFRRVHCRAEGNGTYNTVYDANTRCDDTLVWDSNVTVDFQDECLVNGQACGLQNAGGQPYKLDYFNVSELLNIYATGTGSFDLNGTRSTVGFNLYAPKASVRLNGGGNADPNFMGRLWVDDLDLRGGVVLRIPNGSPSGFDDDLEALNDFWDFIARSFTQSSGF